MDFVLLRTKERFTGVILLDGNKQIFISQSGIDIIQEGLSYYIDKDPGLILLLLFVIKALCPHS